MKKEGFYILLLLVVIANAKLEVINLSTLDQSLFDVELTDIPYSIANFGFSP